MPGYSRPNRRLRRQREIHRQLRRRRRPHGTPRRSHGSSTGSRVTACSLCGGWRSSPGCADPNPWLSDGPKCRLLGRRWRGLYVGAGWAAGDRLQYLELSVGEFHCRNASGGCYWKLVNPIMAGRWNESVRRLERVSRRPPHRMIAGPSRLSESQNCRQTGKDPNGQVCELVYLYR